VKGKKKRELRTAKFKERAVQRMMAGESVSALSRELKVNRRQLYLWRDAYRKEGAAGLRPIGRRGWSPENQQKGAEARIASLEGKIGRQAMLIDFLRRAFRRVEGLRRPSKGDGGPASMERSRP
jgi:transposase-like protein